MVELYDSSQSELTSHVPHDSMQAVIHLWKRSV